LIPTLYKATGPRLTTAVIAHRALQNPGIFTSEHYRQAAYAVAAGIAIRLIIAIPVRPLF
jgi:hypothetical protein